MASGGSSEVVLVARTATLREAESTHAALAARVSVARHLLASAAKCHEDRSDAHIALAERKLELESLVRSSQDKHNMLHEGNAACELRLSLSRDLLVQTFQKLETLRLRGSVAEEQHRLQSIELGRMGERLQERRQQLRDLRRYTLEQRVRVGIAAWRPRHLLSEALGHWKTDLMKQSAQHKRLRDAEVHWHAEAQQCAMSIWSLCVRETPKSADRRQQALSALEDVNLKSRVTLEPYAAQGDAKSLTQAKHS